MNTDDTIVIIGAKRTPIGHFTGVFSQIDAPHLGAIVIADLLKKAKIEYDAVDGVTMGCVLSAGMGQAPARQAALKAGLLESTPCITLNKMCGSGLAAVIHGYETLIANPNQQCIITGGMENMSMAPYLLPQARMGYRIGTHPAIDHMMKDGLEDAFDHYPMGHYAELCAEKYCIDRTEQDAYTIASGLRCIQANQQGLFTNEITPVPVTIKGIQTHVIEDEGISRFNAEKIPKLKPTFNNNGTITAANASNISDGAAALALTRYSTAKKNYYDIFATIKGYVSVAQPPAWFTTAPVKAIEKLLIKLNWSIDDIDLFEVNEAFAVVPLIAAKKLNLPPEKLNIYGGACTIGHPIGASGARILVTLIHALHQKKLKRGIAAICIGGGEAIAMGIEVKEPVC